MEAEGATRNRVLNMEGSNGRVLMRTVAQLSVAVAVVVFEVASARADPVRLTTGTLSVGPQEFALSDTRDIGVESLRIFYSSFAGFWTVLAPPCDFNEGFCSPGDIVNLSMTFQTRQDSAWRASTFARIAGVEYVDPIVHADLAVTTTDAVFPRLDLLVTGEAPFAFSMEGVLRVSSRDGLLNWTHTVRGSGTGAGLFRWAGDGAPELSGMQMVFQAPAPAPVPEPATLLLFGAGAALIARRGWRRREGDRGPR